MTLLGERLDEQQDLLTFEAEQADQAVAPTVRRRWRSRLRVVAITADVVSVLAASLLAHSLGTGTASEAAGVSFGLVAVLLVPGWLAALTLAGAYDPRHVAVGSEEPRRVLAGGGRVLVAIALFGFVFGVDLARGFVGALLPLMVGLTLLGRWVIRRIVHHQRRHTGRLSQSVLLVGDTSSVAVLADHLARSKWAGLKVIGACCPTTGEDVGDLGVPIVGRPDSLLAALDATGADTIVVANTSAGLDLDLQHLAWDLEGTGVELIVAPAITNVAGPRISIRPVDGLPLLHVEQPQLDGPRHLAKSIGDRALAALALVALMPMLVGIALAIKVTSNGPVLYRQTRVGKDGDRFTFVKFRTMVPGADTMLLDLTEANEADGPLFKLRKDPRVTPVGRVLRRLSFDELPQLWHVVTGRMSLVGPRPPLPTEVERYEGPVRRRLLVKPGLTGLWQVSGRSDLSWDETVRLDLHYVDNWSPMLDLTILARTLRAVVGGRGAY